MSGWWNHGTDVDVDKDIDIDVDTDIKTDVDIDVDKDVDVDVDIKGDVEVEGNSATVLADASAFGDNTLVEIDGSAVAGDDFSEAFLFIVAAVD